MIKFPDKVYEVLKWIVMIFLPALNIFICALGAALHFDSETICGVITAFTMFLGGLIGVSTYQYRKNQNGAK